MLVKHNILNNSITINDDANTSKLIHYTLFTLNSLSLSMLALNNYLRDGLKGITILFLILAIVSIYVLLNLIFKKRCHSEIKVQDIAYLKERSILGRKRFRICLINNKHRDIYSNFKYVSEISDFKKVFEENGITIK